MSSRDTDVIWRSQFSLQSYLINTGFQAGATKRREIEAVPTALFSLTLLLATPASNGTGRRDRLRFKSGA